MLSKVKRPQRLPNISSNMPHGAQKKIADQLGTTKGYVSSVLSGARSCNSDLSMNILRKAIEIATTNRREYMAKVEKMQQKIFN
jgi:hypothetical protein